ncbi:hypothetical protein [Agreia sp. COWG]|uniref:hypothetical protein n=1 Tax=Agreia sp. COWG TaxID=2773266 RepID=UPI0019279464|nr:hypothetical protein [Agreia sp. COWG]CAD5993866.1 conserved membrane protein of unknown function [Agreia sp. COWG]
MTTSRDDDALHWAGDNDPTLTPPIQAGAASTPAEPSSATDTHAATRIEQPTVLEQAELAEDDAVEQELARAEKASAQLSSAALITLGIVGGIYLLYTVGWGVHVARSVLPLFPVDNAFLLICYQVGRLLAVMAAPLWFVSTLLLTQKRSWRSRLGWLLLGVFVLVPWPFIVGV